MSHFLCKDGEPFNWKEFQKHRGYTDAEMEAFKKDPKKIKYAQIICSPEMLNKWLIVEVVESHGCEVGLKIGDRLYFEGLDLLDTKRSNRWCIHAMAAAMNWFAHGCRNLVLKGIDPNEIYADHFGCLDTGPKYGWGRVIMKAYVVETNNLDTLG